MPRRDRDLEEERRRLFRRMEWIFVYAPPALAVFIGVFGAAFLAWAVEIRGTNFWGRWALGTVALLVVPAIVYVIRARRDGSG